MKMRSMVLAAAMTTLLAVSMITLGCGKSSSPTSPYSAGGGGGGGVSMSDTPFDSGTLSAPASFDHVFPVAGTIGYHCNFHQSMGMVGTVVVAAGGAATATVTASSSTFRFTPASVTIQPGGTVHWTISSGTHTVTSD
jgi:plastocyanin